MKYLKLQRIDTSMFVGGSIQDNAGQVDPVCYDSHEVYTYSLQNQVEGKVLLINLLKEDISLKIKEAICLDRKYFIRVYGDKIILIVISNNYDEELGLVFNVYTWKIFEENKY